MLIDWFTVAAQVINFLVLVWLLKRFLYKPVLNALDEREKRIAAQLEDAEKKKAQALKEQTGFQQKNEEFERQRAALLADATSAAKTEREKLVAAARQEAEALQARLQKATYDELDNLNRKVGVFAQKEVFAIARKALSDLAGMNLEERMTEVFVRRLHDLDDKHRDELKKCLGASAKPLLVRSAFALSDPQMAAIRDGIKSLVEEGTKIEFETKPELISGLELSANGQKIAWSISDYLEELAASLGGLLEPKSGSAPVPAKVPAHAA